MYGSLFHQNYQNHKVEKTSSSKSYILWIHSVRFMFSGLSSLRTKDDAQDQKPEASKSLNKYLAERYGAAPESGAGGLKKKKKKKASSTGGHGGIQILDEDAAGVPQNLRWAEEGPSDVSGIGREEAFRSMEDDDEGTMPCLLMNKR